MYYTQVTGPGGTTSNLATPPTKKAAEGKAAAATTADGKAAAATTADGKAAAATTDAAKTALTSSPAYTISQSMESLLDAMSGKAPATAAKAESKDETGTATDSSGGSAGSGSGSVASNSNADVKRMQDAQKYMQAALDQSKELAGVFGKAVDSFKSDLGSMLSGLGMSDDKVSDALSSFGDDMNSKMANMDFSNMAMDMQSARSQWSIESRGIELTIKDGDKEVSISFAKSTLDFRKDEQRLQASFGSGGDVSSAMFGQSTTTANAKATGMIVRGGEGFSSDELKGILDKLSSMAAKGGGMKGLSALSPSTDSKGVMHLNVDMSVPVEGLGSSSSSSSSTATAATDAAAKSSVDISA